jgi:hypothetical protein
MVTERFPESHLQRDPNRWCASGLGDGFTLLAVEPRAAARSGLWPSVTQS